jgi:hypothetical protein
MNEAWFFIGIFVFIFIVWIAIGGPTRSVSIPVFPSASTTTVTDTSTSTSSLFGGPGFSLPRAPFSIGTTEIRLPGSSGEGGSGSVTPLVTPLIKVPGVVFSAASPYRDIVTLSTYVSNASSTDAREEYVRLSVTSSASAPVDITGWVLKSGATSRQATIPRGTAIPTSGVVNAASDIVLRPGDSAVIVSGESPVGASFRENKCIGYLGSYQRFTPSLPVDCPSAEDELAAEYGKPYIHDPDCIDYADSLPRCRIPTRSGSRNLTLTCQEFLETHLNYNDCVVYHASDEDFNGTSWRIYLGRDDDEPLWRTRHEVVELLDRYGKTVDAFSY